MSIGSVGRVVAAAGLCAVLAAPAAAQSADVRTRAESSNYQETSTYDDVTRVIDGLKASSSLVHTESFGKTEEGRDLPMLVIAEIGRAHV